jgi:hypothetical protein
MRSAGPAKLLLASAVAVAAVAAVVVAPGPDGATRAAAAEPRSRIPPFSVWVGSYTCPQGVTALRLSIEARSGGEAVASFEFGPHPDNPKLPRGEYRMTGTVRLLSRGQLHVKLAPDRWVTQPDGWSMTGLTATSDLEQQTLEGRIDAQACGELSARREGAS